MGEKENARGYLYQAMACVLAAIREDSRVSVQFEPDFSEEEVNIAFQYRDGGLKAVRVKLFTSLVDEPDVFDSLKAMLLRTPGASSCRLILIGDCSVKTRETIDSIHPSEGKTDKAVHKLAHHLGGDLANAVDKLSAAILPDDFSRFEAAFIAELGPLLQTQGFSADEAQLQYIIRAICYRFNQFATNSRFIPAQVFIRKLSNLVELYYPDVADSADAGLKLQFYSDHRLYNKGSPIKPGLLRSDVIRERMGELRGLYRDISAIPLAPKPALQPSPNDHYDDIFCEYTTEAQAAIREKAKAILKLELPDGFFHVGGLKQKEAVRQDTGLWDTPQGLDGTPIEQHKYEKLERFAQGLTYLEGLLRVFIALDRYDIVPLVLTNTGGRSDKDIRVRVELPGEAALLTQEVFPPPALCVLADLTGEDGLLHRHLKQESDAQVTQYHVSYYPPAHFAYLYIGPQKREQEQKELQADFDAYLGSIFPFETYEDNDLKRRVLEFTFDAIRPGQSIAFPCFLFVQCKKGFTIRYRITSQTLAAPHRGRLEYGVE